MAQKTKNKTNQSNPHEGQRRSDLAYNLTLEALFNRKITAGSFVSQASLVELLGVPVQPLRDALRLLEAEGVLIVHPRSGIEFLKPDLELARSTYQFRTIIERAAARHCARAGDIDYFANVKKEHEALIVTIKDGEFGEGVLRQVETLESKLHDGMLKMLDNVLVTTTARRLKNYVLLIALERIATPPLLLQSLHEHLSILNAIIKRDENAADAALAAHFQASLQRILGMS